MSIYIILVKKLISKIFYKFTDMFDYEKVDISIYPNQLFFDTSR